MTVWLIYGLAAMCEIGGCFAFWAWLRLGKSPWWIGVGIAALATFAWLLTRVPTDAAGRAFAAYGGVYIAASVEWLWLIEKQTPTKWDLLGAGVSVIGALVILAGARARSSF